MLASRNFARTLRTSRSVTLAQRLYASQYQIKTTISEDGTRVSELENGVKIVQIPREDTSISLGLYLNVGSVYETHKTHGSSHYLRRFVYKGTNRTSGLRITRCIENLTSSFEATNGRESIVYKATANPNDVEEVAEILADLLRPRLAEWEYLQVRELVQEDINERKSNQILSIGDKVRHTAFRGVGLGRLPVCPEYNLSLIDPDVLNEYILSNVVGPKITLVITGNTPFEDEALIKTLAAAYAPLPASSIGSAPTAELVPSNYYGGEYLESGGSVNVYVEAYKGAPSNTKEFVAQTILANILGDATADYTFPGNNSNGRLAKEFANDDISFVNSFNTYDSQSLFGVRAAGRGPTRNLAEKVHSQLTGLASKKISQEEFDRSVTIVKNRAKYYNDTRDGALWFYRFTNGDLSGYQQQLESITPEDLQKRAGDILASPRTAVVIGDLSDLPTFK